MPPMFIQACALPAVLQAYLDEFLADFNDCMKAATANSLGKIESVRYMDNYQSLLHLILQIQSAVEGKSESK